MLTRIVSVLACLTILYAVAMGVITGAERKPKLEGFHVFQKPVLALEFADTDAEVAAVVSGPQQHDWLREMLRLDYGFIVINLLLLLSLCAVLARAASPKLRALAAAAALGAIILAVSNVVQNARMAEVIDEAKLVADVDAPGYLKWFLTFAVTGALSAIFLRSAGWVKAVGALCLLVFFTGTAGLAGICFKLSPKPLWLIELAFVLIGLLLVAVAVAFIFFPHKIAGAPGRRVAP